MTTLSFTGSFSCFLYAVVKSHEYKVELISVRPRACLILTSDLTFMTEVPDE